MRNFGLLKEQKNETTIRKGAGVVELARLESVCTGNCTEGSNPSLSTKELSDLSESSFF